MAGDAAKVMSDFQAEIARKVAHIEGLEGLPGPAADRIVELEALLAQAADRIVELEALLAQAADRIGVRAGTIHLSAERVALRRFGFRARIAADGKLICGTLLGGNKSGYHTRKRAIEAGRKVFARRWKVVIEEPR